MNTAQQAPNLEGRFADSYPVMAPFRVWDVDIPPSGKSQADQEIDRQSVVNKLQLDLQAERLAESARRDLRRQKLNQRIVEIQADIQISNTPNPNNPKDWRNWSRWKYWTTPLSNEGMAETAVRAIDIPGDINLAKNLFTKSALKKAPGVVKMPGFKTSFELDIPVHQRRGFIVPIAIKRFVKDAAKSYIEYRVDEYKEKVYQDAIAYVFDNEGQYDDEELWPGYGS